MKAFAKPPYQKHQALDGGINGNTIGVAILFLGKM
jgi:hypothetical protein